MKSLQLLDNVEEWVEGIPDGWIRVQLKYVATKLDRPIEPKHEIVICTNKGTVTPRGDNNPGLVSLTGAGYQGVKPGDLLIHGMDTWHGAIAVSQIEGQCTSVVHVCDSCQEKRFLAYYLRALAFRAVYKAFSNGVRQNTSDFRSWAKAGQIPIILPPLDEQCRIADFLDEKCDEIDRAVSAAERSIEELGLYRSARLEEVIARASHEAPQEKLKYVLKESKEKSPDGTGEPLSITIARGVIRSAELSIPNPTSSLIGTKIVHEGDLVFNKLKAYYGVMYVSPYDGLVSPEYAVYQPIDAESISLKYLEYVFHTASVIDEFIIRISGVADGFRRLYTSDLFDIAVSVPAIEVQQGVVTELDDLYASVAKSIEAKRAIIADLKAYKQSLIYETVTGKREV